MTRPRLQHVPVDELRGRVARPGDRWRVQRAPARHERGRHVWLAGPVELHVLATERSKYLHFTTHSHAFEYALSRAEGRRSPFLDQPTPMHPAGLSSLDRALRHALGLGQIA